MIYRGIVNNGVVILEGDRPRDGTVVAVTPLNEAPAKSPNPAEHPAIGIWKDRADLPADAAEASHVLRQRLMRRTDE